jgi:hypothetical protein
MRLWICRPDTVLVFQFHHKMEKLRFFSKMGWQNDNHLALSSGGVLTNG